MTKKLSKYIPAFDYIDNILNVLSATSGEISVVSFASIIGMPVGIASTNFSLAFSLNTEMIKKLLKIAQNKKKKHNETVMLAISKLSSIETLVSQVLIDFEISHKKCQTIINQKEKYKKMKEDIKLMESRRSDVEKDELKKGSKGNKTNEIIKEINGNVQNLKIFF